MDNKLHDVRIARYARSWVALRIKALKTRSIVDIKKAGEAEVELSNAVRDEANELSPIISGEHGDEIMDLAIQIRGLTTAHPAFNQCRDEIGVLIDMLILKSKFIKNQYESDQQNVGISQFAEKLKAAVNREDLAPLDIIEGVKTVVRDGLGE